ncbi:MAG: TrmO family methyltransferase [Desulfobacterales bacterium]
MSESTKNRPNPIGITSVQILKVDDDYIEIKGLDAIDRTQIFDIKPYYPHYDEIENSKVPEWVKILMKGYF